MEKERGFIKYKRVSEWVQKKDEYRNTIIRRGRKNMERKLKPKSRGVLEKWVIKDIYSEVVVWMKW